MPQSPNPLTLELLTWISSRPRTYGEAMEAWRSKRPMHSVWEDAISEGLIQLESGGTMDESKVTLTPRGRARLDAKS